MERGAIQRSSANWGCTAAAAVAATLFVLLANGFGKRSDVLSVLVPVLPILLGVAVYVTRFLWLRRHQPPPRSVAAIPDVDYDDDPVAGPDNDVAVDAVVEPVAGGGRARTTLTEAEKVQRKRMMKRRVGERQNPQAAAGTLFLLLTFLGPVLALFAGGRGNWTGMTPTALALLGLVIGVILGGIGASALLRDQPSTPVFHDRDASRGNDR